MRAFTPEISWHNRLPTLSVDISKPIDELGNVYRVATGGNDCRVYLWHIDISLNNKQSVPDIRIRAGLRRHQKSVGAVRFSPQDGMLASGDDDGYIYLWRHKEDEEEREVQLLHQHQQPAGTPFESNAFLNDDGFEDLETWQQYRVLRGHIEDICDLAWSKDGLFLLSGSVDNSAILWDAKKCTKIWCSDLIKGYVQGVAFDPELQFMAAISSDRSLRIYNFSDRRLLNATRKMNIKSGKYKAFFCDDTVQTFCRRLEFSPDGQFLLVPTGRLLEKYQTKATNVLIVYKRSSFNKPTHFYPMGREVALCIRFSPIIYKLRNSGEANDDNQENINFWNIPYRFIFAVATSRSVLIYDSQQSTPIGYASQIHLARLTDLSWSNDGRLLMITSYDGYSTLITFDEGEFGEIYTGEIYSLSLEQQQKQQQLELEKALLEAERELEKPPEKPPVVQKPAITMWRYITTRKAS